MQIVHNDNRRNSITVNALPGADAQEIAELAAEQVRAELKRRDQEREDYLDTVFAPRNPLAWRLAAAPVEPVAVPIPRIDADRACEGDGHDREGVKQVIHGGHYTRQAVATGRFRRCGK